MTVISIKPRSKSLRPINVNTTPETRLQDIVNEYAKLNGKEVNRIRLTKIDETGKSKSKQLSLDYSKDVGSNGLSDKDIVYAKDLGKQISWSTVFLVEYIGPIIMNSIFYYGYYDASKVTWTQRLAYIMVVLHFFKREYETSFVHIFSHLTMPIFNLFKNCSHYWILSGVFFGFTLFNDDQVHDGKFSSFLFHVRDCPLDQLIALFIIWLIAELSNLYSHIILRNLRINNNTSGHVIPEGFLFNFITVPNYFTESMGWLVFAIMTMNWSTWLFLIVSTVQMFIWGVKKHKNLQREFPDYPKNRKIFVPFVI